ANHVGQVHPRGTESVQGLAGSGQQGERLLRLADAGGTSGGQLDAQGQRQALAAVLGVEVGAVAEVQLADGEPRHDAHHGIGALLTPETYARQALDRCPVLVRGFLVRGFLAFAWNAVLFALPAMFNPSSWVCRSCIPPVSTALRLRVLSRGAVGDDDR